MTQRARCMTADTETYFYALRSDDAESEKEGLGWESVVGFAGVLPPTLWLVPDPVGRVTHVATPAGDRRGCKKKLKSALSRVLLHPTQLSSVTYGSSLGICLRVSTSASLGLAFEEQTLFLLLL